MGSKAEYEAKKAVAIGRDTGDPVPIVNSETLGKVGRSEETGVRPSDRINRPLSGSRRLAGAALRDAPGYDAL